jgi:hypothetical protein
MVTRAPGTVPGTHSCVLRPTLKQALSGEATDKYGRMFPGLPTPSAGKDALIALGRSGAVLDDASGVDGRSSADNHCIPAGFTFCGQFIAHDITADRSLFRQSTGGTFSRWTTRIPRNQRGGSTPGSCIP